MQLKTWIAAGLLAFFSTATLADKLQETWDGLVEVKTRKFDASYLAPGADFRPYTKVMVDPTQVAFKKDWLKNLNDDRNISRKVTEDEARDILAAARTNFDDIFQAAFAKAGYPVVTTPGPDVLRVATGVINLYLNAPDTMSTGRTRSFTANAGEATLVMELRDSISGALLGRVLDRRETLDKGFVQWSNRVTDTADFRSLFKSWSSITVKGLDVLKEISPLPDPLTPGQKLGN